MADVYCLVKLKIVAPSVETLERSSEWHKTALGLWLLATSNGKSNGNGQTQEPQLTARATTKPFATDPRQRREQIFTDPRHAGTGLRLCATIRNSVTPLVIIDDFCASHAVTFEFTRRSEGGRVGSKAILIPALKH